ncbi:8-oxo-dGTP diphosphatase [Desulfotomaculum arcticum]|uniref:8-oxo-dGTP diphosphatase n=1 Tax=Desulfotruncus arcticus DSM 17038 TaxID=1121424 RepID=A0A1I2N549_9FIRM|nr:(deoxy)nucleoside triphosphate pyrophosphohydrolase [Desulfotruncus arcticus]SFF99035.1 8-oxo-dGTP diphosphatase [Desulfotomaculum arcticum] [Desulfotruncus arcticus DSM 17038]
MRILVVTAAIIFVGDKVLITQRNENVHQALKWEFPGGKIEPGESPEECLAREIDEELGLKINVGDIFHVVSHVYEERQVILLCYYCRCQPSKINMSNIQARDCHDFRWVSIAELDDGYDFSPADIPVVEKLKSEFQVP